MPRFAQLVMGPAGSGKSTYVAAMQDHFAVNKKSARCVNLDPAAEDFKYVCDIDVRELITVDDCMEECDLGPNGGLIYAMDYLLDNLDWLTDQLEEYGDDEYLLFDCPGQIELYSHVPMMRQLVDELQRRDFRIVGIYCIDSLFVQDNAKFLAGCLASLTAMMFLELPHLNVLTKCDLLEESNSLDAFVDTDMDSIVRDLNETMHPRYRALNEAFGLLVSDHALVGFVCLNLDEEESIQDVYMLANDTIQYAEHLEAKIGDAPDED
eukprot:GEMP01057074.1.p1 GENE.GEMP01057074.1~~GEMP01057074.1.p1  ORF type:complete len:266 (+),score=33.36 GEMP01057074.1:42-839(+)